MEIWEILLMSVALAMDACAVAMTNGMTETKMPVWKMALIGVFFGVFQFAMPVIGYFITGLFTQAFFKVFEKISAWVAFALLAFLGGKMLFESIKELVKAHKEKKAKTQEQFCAECETVGAGTSSTVEEAQEKPHKLTIGRLAVQAVATSIDALAIGVTLKMAEINAPIALGGMWGATAAIGVVTLVLSFGSVFIGKLIGDKLADKANLFGGAVLLAIGIKILIEGLIG